MNVKDLKSKSLTELKENLTKLLKSQFDLRMAKGNGQLNKVHVLRDVRRDIARVRTIIRQNELQTNEAGNI